MKIMDRIAIFFVILLVSASAVPAFAGSLGDAPDAPSIEGALGAEAGAGAADNDSRLPDEPLLEPVSPGEDSGGLGEGTPAPDGPPDGDAVATPSPEVEDAPAETTVPSGMMTAATATPTPGFNESEGDGVPEGPDTGLPAVENATTAPQPAETPVPTVDEPEVTPEPTASPEETPTPVDPTPKATNESSSGDVPPVNATTPAPTSSPNPTPSTGSDVVKNESESSGSSPENETAGETPSRAAVLCIWEQLDPAGGSLDDDPVQPGSQFLPPCAYGATKTVEIRAVVTGGGATPHSIVADVTSPDGSAFSRVNLTRQGSATDTLEAASIAGLVVYAHGSSLNEAVRALEESRAAVYVGELELPFSQMPGDYRVSVQVLPEGMDPADQPLAGIFTYLPTASFEIDFVTVDYGTVEPGNDAWVEGDADFGTAQRPTVRNTGNVPIRIAVSQDDMGLDVSIAYTAKLGNNGTPVTFGPMEEVTLPGVLPVNEAAPLSLALKISGGEGTPNGRLLVSCVPHAAEH